MLSWCEEYRPMSFSEIVGQPAIKGAAKAIAERRPSPFYLLKGPAGVGKTSFARLSAFYLNCSKRSSEEDSPPCGECVDCKGIRVGYSPLVQEVNAADLTGVDASRELIRWFSYATAPGKWRVLIMDECHRMSSQAWDVWLKPLESGFPQGVAFFCTTEWRKVPETIVSRSVGGGLHFGLVPDSEILGVLRYVVRDKGLSVDEKVLEDILVEASGSVRKALALLQTIVEGAPPPIREDYAGISPQFWIAWFDRLSRGSIEDAVWDAHRIIKGGEVSLGEFYQAVVEHITNLLTPFALRYRGWEKSEVEAVSVQAGKLRGALRFMLEKILDLKPLIEVYATRPLVAIGLIVNVLRDSLEKGGRSVSG